MVTEVSIHEVKGIQIVPIKDFNEAEPRFYNRHICVLQEDGKTFTLNLFSEKREDLLFD